MTLAFDPDDYDYGPASPAIRCILRDWGTVDWFVPTSTPDAELDRLFTEHYTLARRYAPDRFPGEVTIRIELGGWSAFSALCARVRGYGKDWDWKYGGLKPMCRAHAKACGWSIDDEAHRVKPASDDPGALFLRLDDVNGKPFLVWNAGRLASGPTALIADKEHQESASFWQGYAWHDLMHAIEWELAAPAEPSADPFRSFTATGADANPFLPLLACTRAGAYPFSLARDEYVLFRFAADENALPSARLI